MITFARLANAFTGMWQRKLADRPRARRAYVGGAIIALAALMSTAIFATAPSAAPTIRQEKAWPVSVVTVAPTALAPMFSAFGKVEATRIARMQTDLAADIEAVAVREGQWVLAGDTLVVLDPAQFALVVDEREAELARERAVLARITTQWRLTKDSTGHYESQHAVARNKLQRYEDLFAKRMVAQSLLDEVIDQTSAAAIEFQNHRLTLADFPNRVAEQEARVAQAAAALARARLDLAHTTLYAPFEGPVLAVAASPGNHTVPGTALVEIADADGLEVRVPIPDEYGAAVRRHLQKMVVIQAHARLDEADIVLALARLGSNVRAGRSGLDAFFRVAAAPGAALEIGRVLNLTVTLPEQDDVVALPVQSIYENDRIYEVVDDRLQSITIERVGDHTTPSGEYRVLVRSAGLYVGARIVTTQLPKAITGLHVQPIG